MLFNHRTLPLLALALFMSAVPALAQFEVSPDHFDSPNQKAPAHRIQARKRASHSSAAQASVAKPKQPVVVAKSKKPRTAVAPSAKAKTTTVASR